MTDDQRLKAIQERTAAATPGPWGFFMTLIGGEPDINRRSLHGLHLRDDLDLQMNPHMHEWTKQHEADAQFIANSRADIPWLCRWVERLKQCGEPGCDKSLSHRFCAEHWYQVATGTSRYGPFRSTDAVDAVVKSLPPGLPIDYFEVARNVIAALTGGPS